VQWGNVFQPKSGAARANIWGGASFPHTLQPDADGYRGAAPIDSFPPQNQYELHHMVGNVWEWVSDWWSVAHSAKPARASDVALIDPAGPASPSSDRVKKGGSFLVRQHICVCEYELQICFSPPVLCVCHLIFCPVSVMRSTAFGIGVRRAAKTRPILPAIISAFDARAPPPPPPPLVPLPCRHPTPNSNAVPAFCCLCRFSSSWITVFFFFSSKNLLLCLICLAHASSF
jgi:hypothetical protein